jgi:16S rRNA (adenine1518-N6/adenine1519-N6)-dimethyltransferase
MSQVPFTAPAHKARKRFGQNFLHDASIIERIVRAITPKAGQHLVEIGPGQGAITAPLLQAGADLTTIEIDRDLAAMLRQRFAQEPRFHLVEMDVLKFDFATLGSTPAGLRVLGNLPYNISTPLIFHLLDYAPLIHDMVFMLQLEVVERMAAAPDTDDYGRLSVMVQYHCKVEKLFKVPPGAFNPQPKVDSAIVRLTPLRPLPHAALDLVLFERVVRDAFSQRRKTLRNTLRQLVSPAQFEALGIDASRRAETLALEDYVRIANLLAAGGTSP